MSVFDSLLNPAAVGGAFAQGMESGRQWREEREVRGALGDYARNPDDPAVFERLAQWRPEMAIKIREQQAERQKQARLADLQRRAAGGDRAALGELAGIDLDAWDKLNDADKVSAKERVSYIGQAALAIKQLPPEQRAAAWDRYVQDGVQMGYEGLAPFLGKYSEQALDSAIAQSELVGKAIDYARPDYKVLPNDATLVNVRDPAAVASVAGGAPAGIASPRSKAEYDALPSGAQYTAPDGSVRTKGGPSQPAAGSF